MPEAGIEPSGFFFSGKRFNQLSYSGKVRIEAVRDRVPKKGKGKGRGKGEGERKVRVEAVRDRVPKKEKGKRGGIFSERLEPSS